MTKVELFEDVRAILMEAQADSVADPWVYDDVELLRQLRSAINHLQAYGLSLDVVIAETGGFTTDPNNFEGVLLSSFVCARLISGDLMQKLNEGELGLYFRAGMDVINTEEGGRQMAKVAKGLEDKFEVLLTMALTVGVGGAQNVIASLRA